MGEFFFGYIAGRSRFGKSELALLQLLHVALVEGMGAFYLDPHVDGINRLKPYLAAGGAGDRVIELNLANGDLDATHVCWNPISMQGYSEADIPQRAEAIIGAFAVFAGWNKTTGRVIALCGQAVTALLHLALRLEPELCPTLWTMPRLLNDKRFRDAVVPYLPDHLRRYWTDTYAKYPGDAATPLLNPLARLARPHTIRAMLGSPVSTYNARRAIDEGRIVLACPGGGQEMLMASFLVFDLAHATKSRADVPADERRTFVAFLDELQTYDDGVVVPEFLEEGGKYGARVVAINQAPDRLTDRTLSAIATNASFLATTANSAEGAAFFERQWGRRDIRRMVQMLAQYHWLAQVTHRNARSDPFRFEGVSIEEAWGKPDAKPGLSQLDHAFDLQYRPRTVRHTLAMIEGHDDRILSAIRRPRGVGRTATNNGSSLDDDA